MILWHHGVTIRAISNGYVLEYNVTGEILTQRFYTPDEEGILSFIRANICPKQYKKEC